MRLKIAAVGQDMRIFPTLGEVRLTVHTSDGRAVELQIAHGQLDLLATLLRNAAEQVRRFGAEAGVGHVLTDADFATRFPAIAAFRSMIMAASGHVAVEMEIPNQGVTGFALVPEQAAQLASQLRDRLLELQSATRARH